MDLFDVLAASPLLTVFVTVAIGTAIGAVPLGPLKFGAAGALLVGIVLGALDPRLGTDLGIVQSLGLALFVYTVGLAAGSTFFRNLRRQLPLMAVGVAAILVAAMLAAGTGALLDLDPALMTGLFTGSLTSTPALAAATSAAGGSQLPAVGYSLAYPVAVVAAIGAVAVVVKRTWPARRDPAPAAGRGLDAATVRVARASALVDVPGIADGLVRLSYLARDGKVRVIQPDESLRAGDDVVVVGPGGAVAGAIEHLGTRLDEHLADDRRSVDYRRIVVSDPRVAGRTIAELDFPGRFDGVVTRVRRGDLDLLATEDVSLELGDRVLAVVPRERLAEVRGFLGDSERKVSEVDALTMGIGMALGLAVGLVTIPLGGGITFALGAAAGPLVVGMVLGRLERTGPLVWGLPHAANLTIRQLGLLFFLAAVGLSSGQAFAESAFTLTGLTIVLAAVGVVAATAVVFFWAARAIGVSAPRAAGAFAGMLGQPAILSYATTQVVDERVEGGYGALFALGIIVKIVLVQLLVGF